MLSVTRNIKSAPIAHQDGIGVIARKCYLGGNLGPGVVPGESRVDLRIIGVLEDLVKILFHEK